MIIQLNMIQSIWLAVIFLLIGKSIKNTVPLFSKYAIPSPAIVLAEFVGINPLLALLTASPSLTWGHGTAAAVAPSIEVVGEMSLNLFLGMALITLELWHLIDLALPMLILLIAQCIMMYLYGMFVSYRLMGKNYDSAVIVAGLTGFVMGSTSNAMANMNSVTEKYVYSKTAFFVVPIVGSLFIDFINIGIIYGFIGFLY